MKKRARAITIERDEVVHETPYTRLVVRHYTDLAGLPHEWEMVTQNQKGVGAIIAAMTKDNKLVLERTYRIPLRGEVIELPGGCNDIGGETLDQVAMRELQEETGYAVKHVTPLTRIPNDPGSADTHTLLFFGANAIKKSTPILGDAEIIETVLVPIDALFDFLKHQTTPVDPKVWVAYAFLREGGLVA